MKILIIRNYPSYMDVEKNTYNIQEVGLAKALVRCGNICDIVLWTNEKEKEIIVPVKEYGKIKIFYKNGKTILKNTVYRDCDDLFRQYDILQTAEYNQMESWILAKKYPKKTVIYHGPYYNSFNKKYNIICSLFDRFFLKRYIKLNTKFIAKSELAKEFLQKKGIKEQNICVAGVGIDVEMLETNGGACCKDIFYKRIKEDRAEIKLLYIGRLEKRRNIPFILEVFSIILKNNPSAKLYIIGDGKKSYVNYIRKLIDKYGFANSIVYQDKMEQRYLASIYKCADCFILPTAYEIFGMVLLEAMYYSTIVLTTDNGGSKTLIEHGYNGFVLDVRDPYKWMDIIINTMKDKNKKEFIEKNAHDKIVELYTWDGRVENFIKQYELVREM